MDTDEVRVLVATMLTVDGKGREAKRLAMLAMLRLLSIPGEGVESAMKVTEAVEGYRR
jgi:hypothetical protein